MSKSKAKKAADEETPVIPAATPETSNIDGTEPPATEPEVEPDQAADAAPFRTILFRGKNLIPVFHESGDVPMLDLHYEGGKYLSATIPYKPSEDAEPFLLIKNHSENRGLLDALVQHKIVERTGEVLKRDGATYYFARALIGPFAEQTAPESQAKKPTGIVTF